MPSATHDLEPRAAVPLTAQVSGCRGSILLVEDEEFVRNVTCEVLESAGYRVLVAKNAAEAAATFEQYSRLIDLLITDLVMPGTDGRTLARQLLAQSPELKVIVSSGYPEATDTCSEDRMFFLPKPFSVPLLLSTIGRVVGHARDRASVAACGR